MNTLRIPKVINFGKDALSEAEYPKNALVVTTAPPALSGKWLDRMGIEDYMLYDKVTPEPSIDAVHRQVISDSNQMGLMICNSDITPFTSSMDGSGVTLSYSM